MKIIEDYVTTTDSRVYRMRHRRIHTSCDYCKPNRSENCRFKNSKTWKRYRKTQYKPNNGGSTDV